MSVLYKNGLIYDTDARRFVPHDVVVDDGRIASVGNCRGLFDETVDMEGAYLAPGLVDIHTHGCAGGDFGTADVKLLKKMSNEYLSHGVTSVFATLASAPYAELGEAADRIAEASKDERSVICGVHLEGRYLNPKKRGAHAEHLLSAPDAHELEELVFRMRGVSDNMRLSAAFELDMDGEFARVASKKGMSMSLAHTAANAEEARVAFSRGVNSVTHLYNAMPPLHHREGGAVSVALCNDSVYCELIVDGFHVCPEMVELAYRLKGDRLVLITDSMEATGCADGSYRIAGMPVIVRNGKAVTVDGAIAGSTLRLLDGVKNLAKYAHLPFESALYHATASPAKCAKIYGTVGSIEVGKTANMIVLDKNYNLTGVILRGEKQ